MGSEESTEISPVEGEITPEEARRSRPSRASGEIAAAIIDGTSSHDLGHYVAALSGGVASAETQAARVVDEVLERQPRLGAPYIAKLVGLLGSDNPRVVQTCAHALPLLGRAAPAKVAKRMPALREQFETGTETVRDGVLRTFAALCAASVAYQQRLIDLFERALREAEPATLSSWSALLLPTLKGEPHAQAREVVEGRIGGLPRVEAEKIAEQLGIKLRLSRA